MGHSRSGSPEPRTNRYQFAPEPTNVRIRGSAGQLPPLSRESIAFDVESPSAGSAGRSSDNQPHIPIVGSNKALDIQGFLKLVRSTTPANWEKEAIATTWHKYWPDFEFKDVRSLFVDPHPNLFCLAPFKNGKSLCFQWEVPAVLREMEADSTPDAVYPVEDFQLSDMGESLSRVVRQDPILLKLCNYVVIAGAGDQFEYTTCMRFVQSRWGKLGLEVLEKVCIGLFLYRDETRRHAVPLGSRTAHLFSFNKNFLLARLRMDKAMAWRYSEVLGWICLAVRANPERKQSLGRLRMSEMTPPDVSNAESISVKFYELQPLREFPQGTYDRDSFCWTKIFSTGIIASSSGLPRSGGSSWGRGLKVPFDMMVHLAAVQNYRFVCGGFILHGFFTALVPMDWDQDSNSIRWHFVSQSSEDDFLQPGRLMESFPSEWFKCQDKEKLQRATCFIGWLDEANIMLGTEPLLKLSDPDSMWSRGLKTIRSKLRRTGLGVGAQINIPSGPITLNPSMNVTYTQHSTVQQFVPSAGYAQAVNLTRTRVALILDSESKQAWLVPMLSLLLHMCHMYIRKHRPDYEGLPFANASWDGASAALDAVQCKGDLKVLGEETLSSLLLRLNTNLADTARTRENPTRSHIFASELMDLIFEPATGTGLKSIQISEGMKAWKPLVQKVDAICVGANLGSVICTATSDLCSGCSMLPADEFLLAAQISCLDLLSQRAGGSVHEINHGLCSFGDQIYWRTDGSLWPRCAKDRPHPSVWGLTPEGRLVLQSITKEVGTEHQIAVKRANGAPAAVVPVDKRGAVVFGASKPNTGQAKRVWMSVQETLVKRRRTLN